MIFYFAKDTKLFTLIACTYVSLNTEHFAKRHLAIPACYAGFYIQPFCQGGPWQTGLGSRITFKASAACWHSQVYIFLKNALQNCTMERDKHTIGGRDKYVSANIKYKILDFRTTILNLFSFFRSDKGFKSSKNYHKVLFVTKCLYMYRAFIKTTHSCASMLC